MPEVKNGHRPVAYVLIPTGNLHSVPEIGCEAYVGVGKDIHQRCFRDTQGYSHEWNQRNYTVDTLPAPLNRSRLYRDLCRPGVQMNARVLGAFDEPVNGAYSYLLEGIGTIVFSSYQDIGRRHL
jgi:hypothetical protein